MPGRDNPCPMHLLIPFAAPLADPGRHALRPLVLPGLQRCLSSMTELQRELGTEFSFTPPHELALVRAFGWQGEDGRWPLAAWWAQQDGLPVGDTPLALLTPSHWHLGTEQLSLGDPALLMLDEGSSRAFFEAIAPLFTSEGFTMQQGSPGRWYAGHASLAELPTASLDRVIGRNVDPWLGAGARLLRRLQNEVQMLLHEHPLNQERERRGLLAVNSIWCSGAGAPQPRPAAVPQIDERLRRHALAGDWAAWADAWQRIDADLATAPPQQLTLCGERGYVHLAAKPKSWLGTLSSRWRRVDVPALLEAL